MLVGIARRVSSLLISSRAGYRFGIAALALILGCEGLQNAVAEGDTRTISLHHVHTNEDLTITYKRDGRYDDEALKKINWILRDWRRQEATKMDPHLLDLIWEVQREVEAKQAIYIICGYRAPATNAMLRRRSGGVAQFSQHMLGKAMDFYIPGAPLESLRVIGLRLQRGGVGFYPTSGSPFVHLDVGSVRHWPTMTHDQLVRVFPNGRTVHIPSDGRPLPGYALALADIKQRGSDPSANSLNAARNAGVQLASAGPDSEKSARSGLAKLFGFGKDANDEAETTASIVRTPARSSGPVVTADAAAAKAPSPQSMVQVPVPRSRPAILQVAVASAPLTRPAQPRPQPRVEMASAGPQTAPWSTPARNDSVAPELALAYAAPPSTELTPRPPGIGSRIAPSAASVPVPPPAAAIPTVTKATSVPPATSVVIKQPNGMPVVMATAPVQMGQRFNDPWLRAAITAPNLQNFMTATLMGAPDYQGLRGFMQKPSSSVAMTFSEDPDQGLTTDRFSGNAVVFVATVAFNNRTAFLQ
jgi:uncharacterized protein YcbK (DUF882 family)